MLLPSLHRLSDQHRLPPARDRFYYQDSGQKVCTKCIRVSSTATARDVIAALAEKFRPDMRMLSTPRFAVYEIHESGGGWLP